MKIFLDFLFGNCLGYFFPKLGQIIAQSSGHPAVVQLQRIFIFDQN